MAGFCHCSIQRIFANMWLVFHAVVVVDVDVVVVVVFVDGGVGWPSKHSVTN